MKKKGLYGGIIILALIIGLGIKSVGVTEDKEKTVETEEIQGALVCVACELKREQGAHAQCEVYGHKYGFKLKDGSLWSFIENDRSKLLVSNKVPGKNVVKVTIYGRKFPKAHYIDVDHFKVYEKGHNEKIVCKEYVWCIVFKRMEKAWAKVSYEGKTYNVCCPGCKKSFNKNPKKYVHEEAPSEKH